MGVFLFLWSAPFLIPGIILLVGSIFVWFAPFAGGLMGLISGILIIAGAVVVIVKGLSYSQGFLVLADNPDWTARQALRESKRIMRGWRGDLFVLTLSFIGWGLLWLLVAVGFGMVLGGIGGLFAVVSELPITAEEAGAIAGNFAGAVSGSLWLYPYMYATYANFYKEISKTIDNVQLIIDNEGDFAEQNSDFDID